MRLIVPHKDPVALEKLIAETAAAMKLPVSTMATYDHVLVAAPKGLPASTRKLIRAMVRTSVVTLNLWLKRKNRPAN